MRSVQRTLSLRGIARCSIPYEVLYVIARHRFAVLWQSPGRVTLSNPKEILYAFGEKARINKKPPKIGG